MAEKKRVKEVNNMRDLEGLIIDKEPEEMPAIDEIVVLRKDFEILKDELLSKKEGDPDPDHPSKLFCFISLSIRSHTALYCSRKKAVFTSRGRFLGLFPYFFLMAA